MNSLQGSSANVQNHHETEIISLLNFAKSKLLDSTVLLQLRAVSYVRLCCRAIDRLNQSTPVVEPQNFRLQRADSLYTKLLRQLTNQNPRWWEQCNADEHGILQSSNTEINQLLQSLGDVIQFFISQPKIKSWQKISLRGGVNRLSTLAACY
jgi:hypothetical protein